MLSSAAGQIFYVSTGLTHLIVSIQDQVDVRLVLRQKLSHPDGIFVIQLTAQRESDDLHRLTIGLPNVIHAPESKT